MTTGGLFGHNNEPRDFHEQAWTVTHCGCYHEPRGGERFTAEQDARNASSLPANGGPAVMTAHPGPIKGISSATLVELGPRRGGPRA